MLTSIKPSPSDSSESTPETATSRASATRLLLLLLYLPSSRRLFLLSLSAFSSPSHILPRLSVRRRRTWTSFLLELSLPSSSSPSLRRRRSSTSSLSQLLYLRSVSSSSTTQFASPPLLLPSIPRRVDLPRPSRSSPGSVRANQILVHLSSYDDPAEA